MKNLAAKLNRLPWRSMTALALPAMVIYAANPDCPANVTDDQSDEGSSVHILSGVKDSKLPAKSTVFGTYRTKAATATQKKGCRWRVYHVVKGVWAQTSPAKKGEWDRVGSVFHKGTVKLNAGPVLLQTRDCADWERRK